MSGPARWRCASILTVGAMALGSCSLIGVRSTPRRSPDGTLACSSASLPVLDLLGVAMVGIVGFESAIGVAVENDGCGIGSEPCQSFPTVIPLAIGSVLFVSSLYGFTANGTCAASLPRGAKN